eukprot:2511194-Rhodomonas_salina.3
MTQRMLLPGLIAASFGPVEIGTRRVQIRTERDWDNVRVTRITCLQACSTWHTASCGSPGRYQVAHLPPMLLRVPYAVSDTHIP